MEKMNDLRDLLIHEVQDLYSAEEQIIAALPAMVEKAKNPELKNALQMHLKVTKQQLSRLEQVQGQLSGAQTKQEDTGLLSRLFKSKQVCRGMQGILEEGQKVMKEDMDPDVMDAAIIAASQKVEHYEICGYGTAKAFAEELGLTQVVQLLDQTLNEEYMADDLLTQLAVSRINREAESNSRKSASSSTGRGGASRSGSSVRTNEPEMTMASAARKTAASGRTGGNSAPRGTASDRSITPGRSTAAGAARKTGNTGSGAASKTSGTRGNGSSAGRGGTANGRNSRGR